MAKLRQQAKWLQKDHPDAAASLLEGLEQTFTVNRMNLSPPLIRCLSTTNLVENPNGIVRATTHRVRHYRDAEMITRWVAAGFLEAEEVVPQDPGRQRFVDAQGRVASTARCAPR